MASKSTRQMMEIEWCWPANSDGSHLTAYINAAANHAAALELRETNRLLREIIGLLNGLGRDGLHQVIRYHRRQVAKKNAADRRRRQGESR